MNVRKPLAAVLSAAVLIFGVSCKKTGGGNETVIVIKHPEGETLAKVGNNTLSVKYFADDFISRQGTFLGAPHLNSEEKRKEFVDNQLVQEALFQEAIAEGFFNKTEVIRDVKKAIVQALVRTKLESAQTEYVPSADDIKKYYDTNIAQFKRGEAARATYMLVPFGNDRAKAKATAESMEKEARRVVIRGNTKQFSETAMKVASATPAIGQANIEVSDSGLIEQAAFDAKFGPNVFPKLLAMDEIGTIAPVIEASTGFLVAMKTGYRKAVEETLEEATPKITRKLAFEKRGELYEKYIADLKQKYKVEVMQDKMAAFTKEVDTAIAQNEAKKQGENGQGINDAKALLEAKMRGNAGAADAKITGQAQPGGPPVQVPVTTPGAAAHPSAAPGAHPAH